MSDRKERARDEADRITLYSPEREYRHLFMEGVDWADENPKPIAGDDYRRAYQQHLEGLAHTSTVRAFLASLGVEIVEEHTLRDVTAGPMDGTQTESSQADAGGATREPDTTAQMPEEEQEKESC